MNYLQLYLWLSSIVSVIGLMKHPTKLSAIDHIGGSVVAGIAFGWIAWPFILWANWIVLLG